LNIVDAPATDPNLNLEGDGVGVNLFLDKTTLPKRERSTYTGYYYPNIVPTGDQYPFPDTVTATAFAPKYSFGNGFTISYPIKLFYVRLFPILLSAS